MARKTAPLQTKQPHAGSEDEDDSSNNEEANSSGDDASDAMDDPIAPASSGFGCPIVEEPYCKL